MGDRLSGVGVYSRRLMLALATLHPEVRFDCWYRPHRYFRSWTEPLAPNLRRRILLDGFGGRIGGVFHGLNQRLPRRKLARSVATFHDLFVMTGEYSTAEFRARFTAQARDAARRADAIIAVSAFTAGQVADLLRFDPSRIYVVHHGVCEMTIPPLPREKLVLHVGAIQTRKNVARLVEAFESLGSGWRLALAGSAGYGSRAVFDRIERSPARARIETPGYVGPDELARWYGRASIFAFPSLDEGFGMPVLEAMSAGIPVVASNRSGTVETAGDGAWIVDAENTEELACALRQLAENEQLRSEWAERGRRRAKEFSWDRAAAETWRVYEALS